jgi:hypothetical protein
MSSKNKLDEKTLDVKGAVVRVRLPKINEPIKPEILKNGWAICDCRDDMHAFKQWIKDGDSFMYCIHCGQRYYSTC